jgi:hypothetical protein
MTLWEIGYTDIMDKLFRPSIDFGGVRDGRRTQILCYDIDLSTARDSSSGTGLILNIAGNSFYADADPLGGVCLIHFQDTSSDRALLPLYVGAGAIFNVPFTQVLIENSAQSGKKLRVFYGVDIDFQPGSVSQIAVNLTGGYSAVRPEAASGSYSSGAALAANTADTIFTPAANTNGAIVQYAVAMQCDGVNFGMPSFLYKSSPPATIFDGVVIASTHKLFGAAGAGSGGGCELQAPVYIPAGNGFYFITSYASGVTVNNGRSARYKLL